MTGRDCLMIVAAAALFFVGALNYHKTQSAERIERRDAVFLEMQIQKIQSALNDIGQAPDGGG
jgi:hypothetical protein